MSVRKFYHRTIGFLLIALLQMEAGAWAAQGPTLVLDEAIMEAKGKSPVLRRAEAAEGEASWKPLEALSANLPHFAIDANHLFNAKFQVLEVPPTNTLFSLVAPYSIASLGMAWTVFDGFQGWNNFQAARRIHQASELELSRSEFTLEESVRLRFYQALAAQILADVAEQNVATLQDHLQKTQEILKRGSATKFDLLRVQVQLEEAISEKAAADDNIVLARKNLAVEMGEEDDPRTLVGELPVPSETRIPANLKADSANRTDLQALNKRADAADRSHYGSFGAWVPKVTLTAEKDYYNNVNGNIWGNYRDAYALGIQVSWHFLDGGATIARERQSGYQAAQADAAAEALALRVPQEFETYKRRYFYNAGLYRAKRRAVEMAEESVRLARLGYTAGTRTSTDVLDAELDLIRARAGVIRSQVDGAEALINLELALGSKL